MVEFKFVHFDGPAFFLGGAHLCAWLLSSTFGRYNSPCIRIDGWLKVNDMQATAIFTRWKNPPLFEPLGRYALHHLSLQEGTKASR